MSYPEPTSADNSGVGGWPSLIAGGGSGSGFGGSGFDRFQAASRAGRARLEAFIATLPAEEQRPILCQGPDCQGFVYEWRGPHIWPPQTAGSGWVRHICSTEGCAAGEMRQREEEQAELVRDRFTRLQMSGLPMAGKFKNISLDTFGATPNGHEKWSEQVTNWVNTQWPGCTTGLVLFGSYGVGKTGLAIAAAKELGLRLGISVNFISVADFQEKVGLAWTRKDGSEYELMKKMREADLLILDDWGAGTRNVKDFDENSPLRLLFNVLDKRYAAEKPFIITTNADSTAAFQQIAGERLMNRIYDCCQFVRCSGYNLRSGPKLKVVDPWEDTL